MAYFKNTILITTTSLLMSSAAFAADPIDYNPGDYPPLPTDFEDTGFDWDGFYAGVGLGISAATAGSYLDGVGYIDGIIGYNKTYGNILVGVEAWFGGYSDYIVTGTAGGVEGRVGVLVNEDWLIYTGVGYLRFDAGAEYLVGAWGTEYAVTNDMTIDVKYQYIDGLNTNFAGPRVSTSMNWHF